MFEQRSLTYYFLFPLNAFALVTQTQNKYLEIYEPLGIVLKKRDRLKKQPPPQKKQFQSSSQLCVENHNNAQYFIHPQMGIICPLSLSFR